MIHRPDPGPGWRDASLVNTHSGTHGARAQGSSPQPAPIRDRTDTDARRDAESEGPCPRPGHGGHNKQGQPDQASKASRIKPAADDGTDEGQARAR